MNPKTDSASSASVPKPRVSLFFATAGYVGYIPKAPGTWGSLVGVLFYFLLYELFILSNGLGIEVAVVKPWPARILPAPETIAAIMLFLIVHFPQIVAILMAFGGVFFASRAAKWSGRKDPQFVVIDEVSGQFFTYLFALAPANWKYLGLGFILFRVFDIWKPFPVRQAESLPGGWGIMADDWMAAVYAAIGIWLARAIGL